MFVDTMVRLFIFLSSFRVFLCKSKHKINRYGTAGCSDVSSLGKNVALMRARSPEDQKNNSVDPNREFSLSPAISNLRPFILRRTVSMGEDVQRKLIATYGSPPGDE